jgi:hypothetical protein
MAAAGETKLLLIQSCLQGQTISQVTAIMLATIDFFAGPHEI